MSEQELERLASRFGVPRELVEEIHEAAMKLLAQQVAEIAKAHMAEVMARHVRTHHEPAIGTGLWEDLHRN